MSYAFKYKEDLEKNGFEKSLITFRRRHLLDMFHRLKSKNIVEVGCGTEPIFCWFTSFDRAQIIERSKEFCELAKLKLKEIQGSQSNLSALDVSIENSSFEDCNNFLPDVDFVVLSSILHEVDDPEKFLCHLRSLLKGGEHLYINVPNANSLHRLLAYHAGMIKSTTEISSRGTFFETKRVFTMQALCDLINKCGFDMIESGSSVLKPFTHAQMDRLFDLDQENNESLFEALFYADKVTPGLGSEIWMLVQARKSYL